MSHTFNKSTRWIQQKCHTHSLNVLHAFIDVHAYSLNVPHGQCSQMTFSEIRTNTAGKIRTDLRNSVLFSDMGIQLKDFVSTIEIRHTFLNLTISNYFININPIFKCNSMPYTHTVIELGNYIDLIYVGSKTKK